MQTGSLADLAQARPVLERLTDQEVPPPGAVAELLRRDGYGARCRLREHKGNVGPPLPETASLGEIVDRVNTYERAASAICVTVPPRRRYVLPFIAPRRSSGYVRK